MKTFPAVKLDSWQFLEEAPRKKAGETEALKLIFLWVGDTGLLFGKRVHAVVHGIANLLSL